MTSFFTEFVHTDNGVTCSESRFRDLLTAQECSGAVSYAKSFNGEANYVWEVSSGSRPRGCFISLWGKMYFNTHSTGGVDYSATSICRKGNK